MRRREGGREEEREGGRARGREGGREGGYVPAVAAKEGSAEGPWRRTPP